MIDVEVYYAHILFFDVMLAVRCLTKVCIDIYMFSQFIRVFYFFIAKKREAIRDRYGDEADLTPYNYLIVYMTLFIWALNILYSFSVAVVWSYFQSSLVQLDPTKKSNLFFRITMQPLTWLINFFTVMGLLYLFHYQGIRSLEKARRDQQLQSMSTLVEQIEEDPLKAYGGGDSEV